MISENEFKKKHSYNQRSSISSIEDEGDQTNQVDDAETKNGKEKNE